MWIIIFKQKDLALRKYYIISFILSYFILILLNVLDTNFKRQNVADIKFNALDYKELSDLII